MVLISRRYPFQDGHSCQNKVQGPRSLIYDPWSLILVPRSMILDPILDTWSLIFDLWSMIHDPWSLIHDPWSLIHDPWSLVLDTSSLMGSICSADVTPVQVRSGPAVRFRSVWFRSVRKNRNTKPGCQMKKLLTTSETASRVNDILISMGIHGCGPCLSGQGWAS